MTEQETMAQILTPTADPAWVLSVDGYDPLRESSIESRFAISNGFLGIRGARAASRREAIMPRAACPDPSGSRP